MFSAGTAALRRAARRSLLPTVRHYVLQGNQVKAGLAIKLDDGLYRVRKAQMVKPGKGGAYNVVELMDMRTGTKLNTRFRSSETVEQAQFDPPAKYQFLYADSGKLSLMHTETFEQVEVLDEVVPEGKRPFLVEGEDVTLLTIDGDVFDVMMPEPFERVVAECPPNLKGATAAAQMKPATLDNGVAIKVPPFVETGDRVVVKLDKDGTAEYSKKV